MKKAPAWNRGSGLAAIFFRLGFGFAETPAGCREQASSMTNPRIMKSVPIGGIVDDGADDVLEALNRPARPRTDTLPAPRTMTTEPAPHVTRLEPRGAVPKNVRGIDLPAEPCAAFASLPPVLATIATVAGLDAAMTLAEARGGTRIYVPAAVPEGHWLARAIGAEAAARLAAHYRITDADGSARGTIIELPLGGVGLRSDTWRQIVGMIRAGHTNAQITMRLGVSRDTVKRHRAKLRAGIDGTQLSMLELFEATPGRSLFDTLADAIADELAAALALPPPSTTEEDQA